MVRAPAVKFNPEGKFHASASKFFFFPNSEQVEAMLQCSSVSDVKCISFSPSELVFDLFS